MDTIPVAPGKSNFAVKSIISDSEATSMVNLEFVGDGGTIAATYGFSPGDASIFVNDCLRGHIEHSYDSRSGVALDNGTVIDVERRRDTILISGLTKAGDSIPQVALSLEHARELTDEIEDAGDEIAQAFDPDEGEDEDEIENGDVPNTTPVDFIDEEEDANPSGVIR